LFVCLSVCLSVCLFACLFVCLFVCLFDTQKKNSANWDFRQRLPFLN
jgi:hypothetical protein